MTNLDLPPISLARYVDLLKRRKWQVVPVSLLGMIIGGLIAASVPRYYVAQTEVRFNAEYLLSDQDRQLSDPLEEMLASANPLIRARIPSVLKQLGWQEALVDDADARAEFIDEVTKRVTTNDIGASRRNRSNTILLISYRDTDGQRAADFTNALREAWIKQQLDEVEAINGENRRQVQARQVGIQEEVDALAREVSTFETIHGLDPSVRNSDLLILGRTVDARLEADRRALFEREQERAEIDVQIDAIEQHLDGQLIAPRIPAPPPPMDGVLMAELGALRLRLTAYKQRLRYYQPGIPPHVHLSAEIAALEKELESKTPVTIVETIPNPAYLERQGQLDTLRTRRTTVQGRIAGLTSVIADAEKRLSELPRLAQQYTERVTRLEAARTRLGAVEAELDQVTALAARVQASRPFSTLSPATVPKRPTEPNVTILALMGSLVGLGVAVGLIFALDAVRFTYKTLDDLERGLPVPVLGGISHVETLSERSEVRRGRWVVSTLAILLLFLVVAVATFYYVAPARLPTWARDVLDMVLGGGE